MSFKGVGLLTPSSIPICFKNDKINLTYKCSIEVKSNSFCKQFFYDAFLLNCLFYQFKIVCSTKKNFFLSLIQVCIMYILRCIQALDELQELGIAPLMLKKQPDIVTTVKRISKYVGPNDFRFDWLVF